MARWDYLDLRSAGFTNDADAHSNVGGTGILHDLVLGVNWYWNANAGWQVNYVRAWRDSDTAAKSGTVDGLGVRFVFYY